MPSEHQSADRGERQSFPGLAEDIGEDPARWLDRDLFEHGITRLEANDGAGYRDNDQRLVRDGDVSAPGELIRDRISGIDEVAVAKAWRAVERRLERTPDGGRDVVISYIEDRLDELQANGERDLPGRDGAMLRSLGVEAYEVAAPKPDVVILGPDGEPTGRSDGSTASQKLATMADGGEEE